MPTTPPRGVSTLVHSSRACTGTTPQTHVSIAAPTVLTATTKPECASRLASGDWMLTALLSTPLLTPQLTSASTSALPIVGLTIKRSPASRTVRWVLTLMTRPGDAWRCAPLTQSPTPNSPNGSASMPVRVGSSQQKWVGPAWKTLAPRSPPSTSRTSRTTSVCSVLFTSFRMHISLL